VIDVALDPALLGWTLRPAEPYRVGREKVREFAAAVGETAPVTTDPAAARADGHRDVVAPPTFAIIGVFQGLDAFVARAGIDYARVVHADQRFELARPIVAGDELASSFSVDRLRALGGNDVVTLRCELRDAADALVCTALSTIVVSPEPQPEPPPAAT
jgi:acyl dehydratase